MTTQSAASEAPVKASRLTVLRGRPFLSLRGLLGRHLSVRWKLTLWYALVYLLTLVVIGVAFPAVLDFQTRATVDANLKSAATRLVPRLQTVIHADRRCTSSDSLLREVCLYELTINQTLNQFATRLSAPGQFAQVQLFNVPGLYRDPQLKSHYAPRGVVVPETVLFAALDGKPQLVNATPFSGENEQIRAYIVRLQVPPLLRAYRIGGLLEVLQAEHTYVEIQRAVVVLILLGVPLGLLLALIVGWWIARVALRPIGRISRTVQSIGESQDLARRINYVGPNDELKRLAETFDRMMDRIEKVFITQRRFIGDASHELRTPLTAIRGNADLLAIAPPDEREVCIASIQREAERMSRLIGDLLLLAEADVAERVVHLRPMELAEILEEVYRSTVLLAGDKLTVNFGPVEPATVMGDPDRLKQLFLNLTDNAVKYTPPGGRVTISLRNENGQAVVKVTDTGIGIPVDQQEAIFRRFYRVESSRSMRGSGLGLAICVSIAEAHGGTVDVRGKPGQGSTFTVKIPLLDADGSSNAGRKSGVSNRMNAV